MKNLFISGIKIRVISYTEEKVKVSPIPILDTLPLRETNL